jgi:protein-tyrosine phosphatase
MQHPNILEIPGVKNFREVKGYTTNDGRMMAKGRLFRSGHFADLAEENAKLVANHRISTVIDFRSASETDRFPALWHPEWTPRYYHTPIGGNAAAWVRDLYDRLSKTEFPADELRGQFILAFQTIPIANANGLKRMFDILIDDNDGGAALFHCTAGKDRTGIAGALILKTLGVNEEHIFEDFLLTNDAVDLHATASHYATLMSEKAGKTIEPADVHPLVGVEPDFLKAAFNVMTENFGSIDEYLTQAMGLTPDRREALKSRFLT